MPDTSLPQAETPPRQRSTVVEWLLLEGWREPDTSKLIRAIGERLVADGVPVWRMFCIVPSLHPQYFGEAYIWRLGQDEVERNQGLWELRETEAYRNNPIWVIVERGAAALRRRLVDPDAELDFDVLVELKEQGGTDYVILSMEFGNGERSAISFASKDPNGFTCNHLRQLNDLAPVLARVIEAHSLRATTVNLLDTYVGQEAGMRILNGEIRRGTARSIYAAVMYSDLRGFTAMSESLPRDTVIDALNAYFEAMTAAVHSERGQVLKYIGDGMLAIFPVEEGRSAADACCRALDATAAGEVAMAAVNEVQAAANAPILDYGVALHLGEVMFGNIGAANRLDFTAIGPAVNVAQRLESLCRKTGRRPLLSREFVEACSHARESESLGRFELRGLATPREVYTPIRER